MFCPPVPINTFVTIYMSTLGVVQMPAHTYKEKVLHQLAAVSGDAENTPIIIQRCQLSMLSA